MWSVPVAASPSHPTTDGSEEVAESTMQRMTGIDPMFVYSDTPHTPMEIAYVCVFDASNTADGYSFARVRDVIETRLSVVPPFRRRLMTLPWLRPWLTGPCISAG